MTLDMLALKDAIVAFAAPNMDVGDVDVAIDVTDFEAYETWTACPPRGDEVVLWALARDCVGGARHWRVRQLAASTGGWWTRRAPGFTPMAEWRFVPMTEWLGIYAVASTRRGFADEVAAASA